MSWGTTAGSLEEIRNGKSPRTGAQPTHTHVGTKHEGGRKDFFIMPKHMPQMRRYCRYVRHTNFWFPKAVENLRRTKIGLFNGVDAAIYPISVK